MTPKKLIIKNVGKIKDETIEINKPLLLFYGDIMQGKTTILNCIRYCFGGSYPSDIIRHGAEGASVVLEFEGGSITREWYRGKDGSTKDREIKFIMDGKLIAKPTTEIKKFLNPFLLDQDYLRKMSESERKAYFTQTFAVNTEDLDKEITQAESEAKDLRATIKGYGTIDLTEYKSVDVSALKVDTATIKAKHQKEVEEHNLAVEAMQKAYAREVSEISGRNNGVAIHNSKVERSRVRIADAQKEIDRLSKLVRVEQAWLKENPLLEQELLPLQPQLPYPPPPPDISALEAQISNAAANEVRVEQYKKNLARAEEKKRDEGKLGGLEDKLKGLRKQKTAKLAEISKTCGVKDLAFDESGNFTFEGTQAGMLSTSQIMRLSSELSNLYPKGFGLDLIDRGESLGKTFPIELFVEKAEAERKTILATIVGEKPAKVPENVGVFVVEEGEVK